VNRLPPSWPAPRDDTTETVDGLYKLIVYKGVVLGGVLIRCPHPWVYRKPYLEVTDVD